MEYCDPIKADFKQKNLPLLSAKEKIIHPDNISIFGEKLLYTDILEQFKESTKVNIPQKCCARSGMVKITTTINIYAIKERRVYLACRKCVVKSLKCGVSNTRAYR